MKKNIDPGYWDELKIKLKNKYPQLAARDFQHKEGEEERMMSIIQYKLRISKDQMNEIIKSL